VKSPKLKPYFQTAVELRNEFNSFKVRHIGREKNKRADSLANEAMDRNSSYGFDLHEN